MLLSAVFRAHQVATRTNQNNVSNVALVHAAAGSGQFSNALVAAISATGGTHTPVMQARRILYSTQEIGALITAGMKVPGWGNSFYKDRIDPAWEDVDRIVSESFRPHSDRLAEITELLHAAGKKVYPNAAAFTAVTAEVIGLPWGLEPMLVLIPRMPAWGGWYSKYAK